MADDSVTGDSDADGDTLDNSVDDDVNDVPAVGDGTASDGGSNVDGGIGSDEGIVILMTEVL